MKTIWPGYMGTTTNLRIVLNTPKNPYLIIKLPKNFLPQKIQELKISRQAPQNRLIIPVTWNLEYTPPPPQELTDVTLLTLFVLSWGRPQCLYLGATLFFPPKYAAYLRVLLINSAVMLGTFSIRNWGIISCSWLILLFFLFLFLLGRPSYFKRVQTAKRI